MRGGEDCDMTGCSESELEFYSFVIVNEHADDDNSPVSAGLSHAMTILPQPNEEAFSQSLSKTLYSRQSTKSTIPIKQISSPLPSQDGELAKEHPKRVVVELLDDESEVKSSKNENGNKKKAIFKIISPSASTSKHAVFNMDKSPPIKPGGTQNLHHTTRRLIFAEPEESAGKCSSFPFQLHAGFGKRFATLNKTGGSLINEEDDIEYDEHAATTIAYNQNTMNQNSTSVKSQSFVLKKKFINSRLFADTTALKRDNPYQKMCIDLQLKQQPEGVCSTSNSSGNSSVTKQNPTFRINSLEKAQQMRQITTAQLNRLSEDSTRKKNSGGCYSKQDKEEKAEMLSIHNSSNQIVSMRCSTLEFPNSDHSAANSQSSLPYSHQSFSSTNFTFKNRKQSQLSQLSQPQPQPQPQPVVEFTPNKTLVKANVATVSVNSQQVAGIFPKRSSLELPNQSSAFVSKPKVILSVPVVTSVKNDGQNQPMQTSISLQDMKKLLPKHLPAATTVTVIPKEVASGSEQKTIDDIQTVRQLRDKLEGPGLINSSSNSTKNASKPAASFTINPSTIAQFQSTPKTKVIIASSFMRSAIQLKAQTPLHAVLTKANSANKKVVLTTDAGGEGVVTVAKLLDFKENDSSSTQTQADTNGSTVLRRTRYLVKHDQNKGVNLEESKTLQSSKDSRNNSLQQSEGRKLSSLRVKMPVLPLAENCYFNTEQSLTFNSSLYSSARKPQLKGNSVLQMNQSHTSIN